jgi:uncharacterized flavoprotein (TIGR03862 family)
VNTDKTPTIAIVGGGPAGLMAAETAAQGGARVTVYDAMPSVGRKFLMAGRGGLNLTHSEPFDVFLTRYLAEGSALPAALNTFPPHALREWCEGLGEETFVGTSGRVFPKAMKASPLLRRWLSRLTNAGVTFRMRHRWTGWDKAGNLIFQTSSGEVTIAYDAAILALGGASWPRLGSTGDWVAPFSEAGIVVMPLRPANCGFKVAWSTIFLERFEGHPFKRIALSFGGATIRGEAIVTREGIEGGAIYALSAALRDAIKISGEAILHVDLRPEATHTELAARLNTPRKKQSLATFLRKSIRLPPVAIGLLHEAAIVASTPLATMTPDALAAFIKAAPVRLLGVASIAKAISTVGGISFDAIDGDFMLRKLPHVFVAGEMLDWEAPTGGYLLQAAFATGVAAGKGAVRWVAKRKDESKSFA